MFKPFDDIGSAGGLLGTALKQYLVACSTFDPRAHPIPKSLCHLIENELLALESYETMIRQAKSALGHAKNSCSTIAPINSLPAEILSRVFTLAMDGSCRGYEQDRSLRKLRFPKYPDVLLRVCYRWRQIATSSWVLWSHIDIIPRYVSTTGLLTRAEALVALANQSPLELHISGAVDSDSDADVRYLSNPKTRLLQFISSIAPRLQSLEFITHTFEDFHLSILKTCIMKCTPGKLIRLIIQRPSNVLSGSESKFGFLKASGTIGGFGGRLQVDIQQGDLEALWLPIKVLDLHGIYPPWSSKVYHGLVELRLPPLSPVSNISITITEAQLIGILKSSPQLRLLCLGLEIKESLPKRMLITPVRLDNLEALDLSYLRFRQSGTVLRWITTGPKPPIVALRFSSSRDDSPNDEIRQFLARSRTTNLAVCGPLSNDWRPDLLSLSPHLQIVVLKGLGYSFTHEPVRFPDEHGLPLDFRPNCLHLVIHQSIIDFGWLRKVLERRPIRRITLWATRIYYNRQVISSDEVEPELLQVCPVVRILSSDEPNPIKDWDLLD